MPRKTYQGRLPDYNNTLGRIDIVEQTLFQGHMQNARLGPRPRIQSRFKARHAPAGRFQRPMR